MDEQRVKYCEAFYLSSDLRYRIQFEFKFDVSNFHEREGFEQLIQEFANHVEFLGTVNPFPVEFIHELDDAGLDRLLQDTELIPNMTFFLKISSSDVFYAEKNCEPYRLRGANGVMSMVETLDGKVIDILEMRDVLRVFERVGRRDAICDFLEFCYSL